MSEVEEAVKDVLAGRKVTKKFRGLKDSMKTGSLLWPNQVTIEKGQLEVRSAANRNKLKVALNAVDFAQADSHVVGIRDRYGFLGSGSVTFYGGGTTLGTIEFSSPAPAEAAAEWITAVVQGVKG